jgi:SLOG cluster2/Trypsin-like peptidase domain/Effector-associated domain 1
MMAGSAATISTDLKRAPLAGKNIGLSISDNQDRESRGFARIHQSTFMYEIARSLYRSGASISYGGHLGNEGFTVASLQHLIDEQQSALENQTIQSYVAWPLYCRPATQGEQLQDDFLKFAEINELPPPEDFVGPKDEFLDAKPIPNRYFWFRSLTALRHKTNSEIHARVVLGGKLSGFIGRYPGIVEEVLFAVTTKLPLYICGGFGGAAEALAQLFQGKTVPDLESFSQYADGQYATSVSYYEVATDLKMRESLSTMTPYERFVRYSIDYPLLCEFFRAVGVAGLNNGLSPPENAILFETPSLDEIRTLVLTGLMRLLPAQESSRRETGNSPDTAFQRAIQRANGPRSPLINDFRPAASISADELLSMENELFQVFGDKYLVVRQSALQQCASGILEQFSTISNARSLLSLDLASLRWVPVRGDVSALAEFLAELQNANPAITEGETVRRHLPSDSWNLILSNRAGSPTPSERTTAASIEGLEQEELSKSDHALRRRKPSGVTPMQLSGPQMEVLVKALAAAYTLQRLQQMLKFRLDKDLEDIAIGDNKMAIVFELVSTASREGWWPQLVAASRASNSGNAVLVEAESRLLADKADPAARDNLEKIVDLRSLFQDVNVFGQRYGRLETCVCAVEDINGGRGTGWLVAPDIVITNYHVVEKFINGQATAADLRCRFDFKVMDGASSAGRSVKLANGNAWCIASRPFGPSDFSASATEWERHQLDYALLRLAEPVGDQPVGENSEVDAPKRGWITIQSHPPMVEKGDRIWVFQHPQDDSDPRKRRQLPMKLADGRVLGFAGAGIRLRHDASTLKGSSGSPCCNIQLVPVALHHAGDPRDWPDYHGEYNQAIPLALIVADLLALNVEKFWDKEPPRS